MAFVSSYPSLLAESLSMPPSPYSEPESVQLSPPSALAYHPLMTASHLSNNYFIPPTNYCDLPSDLYDFPYQTSQQQDIQVSMENLQMSMGSFLPIPQSLSAADTLKPMKKSASQSSLTGDQQRRQRPPRFRPTEQQLAVLASIFEKNPFPSQTVRSKIAREMGLENKQVLFWFQNRRATLKNNGIHVIKPKTETAIGKNR
ncbi:Homeodomain-like protein [Chytriomyces cf. hyalinus JEL632]|nr:Homeodomain-like protein [Chytriomyces cf. hyalinus JEL632]